MIPPFAPGPDAKSFQRTLRTITDELQAPAKSAGMLFYTYYSNHLDYSRIADRKAHFMIALNVFLLSLVITRKHLGFLSLSHYLLWPNMTLVVTSLGSVVLAIIVTRPVVPRRPAPGDTRPVNWFFFGSFCHRPLQEYHQNIRQLMQDEAALYRAMSRDLYFMGLSLAKKYRRLTRCYQFFYYGLLVTALGYVAAFGWHFLQ